jgi:hypothetical protein
MLSGTNTDYICFYSEKNVTLGSVKPFSAKDYLSVWIFLLTAARASERTGRTYMKITGKELMLGITLTLPYPFTVTLVWLQQVGDTEKATANNNNKIYFFINCIIDMEHFA